LQVTSSVKRPRPTEPQTGYVSLKESQDARERLLRSATNEVPDNAPSDDGFDDDSGLQRRVRQKREDEKVDRQFATVTAPARPGTSGRTAKAVSLSPTFGRQHSDHKEIATPKSFQVEPITERAPTAN